MATATTDQSVRESYARDASGLKRVPDSVARPQAIAELIETVREALVNRTPITMAGGQTSTTAASITDRGLLISTRAISRIIDVDLPQRVARVEPGVILGDLNRAVADGLAFAPDPTSDQECTIGGAIACNASGSRTLRYGPTRAHVRSVRVLLADGSIEEIRRRTHEKNTVGYSSLHDPVDWFVGSEGTLGVILDAEVSLVERPSRLVGLAFPFTTEADALNFVVTARESGLAPQCLEYFDDVSVGIVRKSSEVLHTWAPHSHAMVYAEAPTNGEDPPFDAWFAIAERSNASADDIQVFDGDAAILEARRLRHAVPAEMHERVATSLAHGGRRVSTDWAVPYRRAAEALAVARDSARAFGVEPVTYGHLGNGHPHQNFVALDPDHVERCEKAVEQTLRAIVAMDGTFAAEHGVGKLKRRWLPLQLTPLQTRVMQSLKRELDPNGLLAPGNIWT
jgi:glycolate oxidase